MFKGLYGEYGYPFLGAKDQLLQGCGGLIPKVSSTEPCAEAYGSMVNLKTSKSSYLESSGFV